MTRLLIAAAVVLVSASSAFAQNQNCTTVQPSPAFVCVDGGWLPPNHPNLPAAVPPTNLPPADPSAPPYGQRFRVGRRYVRGTSDVFIAGAGQLADGTSVLFAICQAEGDNCFQVGFVRTFLAIANANDWREQQPQP
jgi:hypothetical protein